MDCRIIVKRFLVTKEEDNLIKKMAELMHMTLSEYLRFVALSPARKLEEKEIVR